MGNEPFEASDRGWCQRQPDQMDGSAVPRGLSVRAEAFPAPRAGRDSQGSAGLSLPRQLSVRPARASSSSVQRAGLVSQQDSWDIPGTAPGTGINRSGFQGAAHCPEPAVPGTDLLPEPWTFLTGLLGVSNLILLSLASVWEVMNLGVGALLGEKFLRESS